MDGVLPTASRRGVDREIDQGRLHWLASAETSRSSLDVEKLTLIRPPMVRSRTGPMRSNRAAMARTALSSSVVAGEIQEPSGELAFPLDTEPEHVEQCFPFLVSDVLLQSGQAVPRHPGERC